MGGGGAKHTWPPYILNGGVRYPTPPCSDAPNCSIDTI